MRIKSNLIKRISAFNQELSVVFGEKFMHCEYLNDEIHLSMSQHRFDELKAELPASFSDFFQYFDAINDEQRLSMKAEREHFQQLYHVLTRAAYHLRKPQGILAYQAAVDAVASIRESQGENQPLNDGYADCLTVMRNIMTAVSAYQAGQDYTPAGSSHSMRGDTLKYHIRDECLKTKAYAEALPAVKHSRRLGLALSVFGSIMMLGAGVMMVTGVLALPGVGLMAAGLGVAASGLTLFQKRARVTKLSRALDDFQGRYQSLGFSRA